MLITTVQVNRGWVIFLLRICCDLFQISVFTSCRPKAFSFRHDSSSDFIMQVLYSAFFIIQTMTYLFPNHFTLFFCVSTSDDANNSSHPAPFFSPSSPFMSLPLTVLFVRLSRRLPLLPRHSHYPQNHSSYIYCGHWPTTTTTPV